MNLIAYTDGGARNNPGPAGIGIVIMDADTGEHLEEHAEYIGETTNNQAEYRAVIHALERAVALGAKSFELRTDSKLVVEQMNGNWKVKEPGIMLRVVEARGICRQLSSCRFKHVPRAQNAKADELANKAMDRGMGREV
ncbi:MAG: reverse transcriptase-like protein [bacterium]|nr:reverse transcriptase-like protein [bacterium]